MIHIVGRADFRNAGDYLCGRATEEDLRGYEVVRHDIDDVQWNYIRPEDTAVLGASGMLNVTESFNRNIIRLLDTCPVIGYGVGFNKTPGQDIFTDIRPHLGKFKAIGIRDYNHPSGLPYLPCPTARLAQPTGKKVLRKVGVIHHRDYKVPGTGNFPAIDNSRPYWQVLDFIETSEIVISSSYHVVFWAQLLGKFVILGNPFSEKFDFFRHPVPSWNGEIPDGFTVPHAPDFRAECLELLDEFCLGIKLGTGPIIHPTRRDTVEGRIANLSWRMQRIEQKSGGF